MTTTTLPNGTYRIEVTDRSSQPLCLTRENGSNVVTILPPNVQSDPDQKVTCHFLTSLIVCCSPSICISGQSLTLIMETSSSSARPGLSRVLSLLTKTLPRNPRKATESYTVFLNFPRMNGKSSRATFVLLVPISVFRPPHSRFIHL